MSPTPDEQELIDAASAARANAYAPFSEYKVGAAVRDDRGRVTAGANVENSSYGLTICAERVAIGAAVAAGAKRIVAAAVVTDGAAAPCGACRQFLFELGPDCRVLLVGADGAVRSARTIGELLPDGFRLAR
ncbi:cytidine deaminase [Botrimarina sp.]|uniref:cytidine deaminase n=1 Tax=Botrimarina sp. TaxID=2795802 RepID=UPI0032EEBA20